MSSCIKKMFLALSCISLLSVSLQCMSKQMPKKGRSAPVTAKGPAVGKADINKLQRIDEEMGDKLKKIAEDVTDLRQEVETMLKTSPKGAEGIEALQKEVASVSKKITSLEGRVIKLEKAKPAGTTKAASTKEVKPKITTDKEVKPKITTDAKKATSTKKASTTKKVTTPAAKATSTKNVKPKAKSTKPAAKPEAKEKPEADLDGVADLFQ